MAPGPNRSETTGGGGDPAAGRRSGGSGPSGVEKLTAGPEFDLIRRFYPQGTGPPRDDVLVGAGDDAAVVRGAGIVLSTDMSVEGVHFRRDWLTPREIGFRATVAALSDLAAMAARPIGVLASLALRTDDAGEAGVELMEGVRKAVEGVGGALLGGDVAATSGPLVIDIVAVGEAREPALRSGAREGDEIWVTGSLGAPGLAVEMRLGGREPPDAAWDRFRVPTARIAEARWLAERGVPAAMLDVSDGIAGDAGHIARASGVAVVIDERMVPLHPSLRGIDPRHALELALRGGEEYELLLACRPGALDSLRREFDAGFACGLARIGSVQSGEGVHLRDSNGAVRPLDIRGYQHFRPSE